MIVKYIYVLCIGVFILFSLIGYLVEIIKNSAETENDKQNQLEKIMSIEDIKLNEMINSNNKIVKKEEKISEKVNSKDELLEDYNKGDL